MLGLLGKLCGDRLHVPIGKRHVAFAAVPPRQSLQRPIPPRSLKWSLWIRVGLNILIELQPAHLIEHLPFPKDELLGRRFDSRRVEKEIRSFLSNE